MSAYAWFEPETGLVKHVSLIENHTHPEGTLQIKMERQSAIDVLTGASPMVNYIVYPDEKTGELKVTYRNLNLLQLAKFWQLTEQVPFMGKWNDADTFESPLRIHRDETHYRVKVVSKTLRGKVYVTLKNDPNYLIKTINMQDLITTNGIDLIAVPKDNDHEYSFYVRYNHAS